ncbi:MAG: leucine-rich repeat protein [Roseburia sp.]|nr:leucine-rich repeat protein [Roseburia sp.]
MRKRKILSVALLVCMLVSVLPVQLLAAQTDVSALENEEIGEPEDTERMAAPDKPEDVEGSLAEETSETTEETETSEDQKNFQAGSTEEFVGDSPDEAPEATEDLQDALSFTLEDLDEEIMELADESGTAVSGSCGVNLSWTFDAKAGILQISGTGEMENYEMAEFSSIPWNSQRENIKKVVIEPGVTSIGSNAFLNCINLTEAELPESVSSIGSQAFDGCISLREIEIPDKVTSIKNLTFINCSGLKKVTLPEGITSIEQWAFMGCTLQELTMPNGIENVAEDAFKDTTVEKLTLTGEGTVESTGLIDQSRKALKEVVICQGITEIDADTFGACENLVRVELPEGITRIGERAFEGCTKLKGLVIPESVEFIGQLAFAHCESLEEIRVPEGITSIPWMTFSDCTNLRRVEIPDSVTSIEFSAFNRCMSLETIVLPEGLTFIGQAAFSNCSSLTNLVIPESVEQIDEEAFMDCLLVELTLPNGIENLAKNAFDGNKVKKLTVTGEGDLVNYKGMDVGIFYFAPWTDGADNLEEVVISNGITGIDEMAFAGCINLTKVQISDTVAYIGESAFSLCLKLREIVIPDSVTFMAERVFEGCENLTRVTLPSHITSIEDRTFDRCNLTSVELPAGVTSIGERAFAECQALEKLTLPEGLESIGNSAFSYCGHLTSLVIPDSVTSVGDRAFEECEINNLTLPNNAAYSVQAPFAGNPLEKVMITGTGEAGSDIASVISPVASMDVPQRELVISRGISGIADLAFTGGGGFARIELADTVTHIGKNAFWMNGITDTIIVPDSVTSIGEGAFSECLNITQIHIPEKVTRIENSTYAGCWNLTSVDIPDSVTYIGNSAFGNCSKLQEIIIPDNVTAIGAYAFSYCADLKKIVILDNVTEFGEKVFDQSPNVTIYGYTGSEAEAYADAYQIPFVPLTKPEEPEKPDPEKPEPEEPEPEEPGTEDPEKPEPEEPGTEDPEKPDITESSISNCVITVAEETYVYDGTEKRPETIVKFGDETLTEDEDYTLIYGNNTNAGIATVTVIGMGRFSGGVKKIFSISPKEISDLSYRYFEEVSYRGLEVRPSVAITYGELSLKNLTDYVLNYENNIEVGTASLIITGTGNYKGMKRLDFVINPKSIASTLARLEVYSYLSDGKEKTPEVIVMNGRDRLVENQDYTLTYVNNVKPGVAVAFLEGIGNYTGTLQLKFTIRLATPVLKSAECTSSGIKISWKKASQADSYKLFRRVKDSGKWEIVANLTGTSYTDKKANTNGRIYQYKVYGVSDDKLSSPSGFLTIGYLARPDISSVRSSKPGQITVKWKRNKKAEGYEIQYATKKDFSNAKKVTVSGGKTVKKTITKLKKNQKYYIRIRSYTRSVGNFYSPWSAKKSLKTAK